MPKYFVEALIPRSQAFALPNNNSQQCAILSLLLPEAGEWDAQGCVGFETNGGAQAIHYHIDIGEGDGIETAPARGSTNAGHINFYPNQGQIRQTGVRRFSITKPTVIKLRALAEWINGGGQVGYGYLAARRAPDEAPPPPPPPPSPGIDQFTALMLHCNGIPGTAAFPDSSQFNRVVTVGGGAHIGVEGARFGVGALTLDGEGDWLSLPAGAIVLSGDYALDLWIFTSDASADQAHRRIISIGGHANGGIEVTIALDGTVSVYAQAAERIRGSTNVANGALNHIALTRAGGRHRLFVNGLQQGVTWDSVAPFGAGLQTFIGRYPGSAVGHLRGAMSEIRISNGAARWTSNFTPPDQPYSA